MTWIAHARGFAEWCRGGFSAYPELMVGERYVCDVSGDGRELGALVFTAMGEWLEVGQAAEGVVQSGGHALMVDETGRTLAVPRAQVLWRTRDHVAVVAATTSLGLRLVPRCRRPVPSWWWGSRWTDAHSLAELGRMLVSDRR